MHKIIWSELPDEYRKEIIKALEGGASPYTIAKTYGLHPESLARKWRDIRLKRKTRVLPEMQTPQDQLVEIMKKADKVIEQSRQNESESEEDYRAVLPETNILSSFLYPKFSGKVLGAVESIPDDRYMYIDVKEPFTALFVTDTHFGQHDEQACDTFIKLAEKIPHDVIINGGDALECYGLSRYGKDPNQIFKSSLRAERKAWKEFNLKLNGVSKAPKWIIAGNHIARYFEWQKQNPAVMALDEFQLDHVLELKDLGYEPMVDSIYIDAIPNSDFPNPKLLFHHGSVSRRNSGASSRAESENRGYVNSISGHVHRLSVAYRRTMSGQILNAEGGTLRTLQPGWMEFPDWQHGCLIVTYDPKTSYVTATPVLFIDGTAYVNGQKI